MIVGVIADTHGLLRPEAVAALRGSDLIVHAGDVGRPEILEELAQIAPVVAVRGNVDHGPWAQKLHMTEVVEAGPYTLYVLHDLESLAIDPAAAGFDAVISGHSHRPALEKRNSVLYINPGSAGPRRFSLPISVGRLIATDEGLRGELVTLESR
ncbi:MAG: metallophosphoesterase family protein [Chloroflexi bacterium]|nr:metallophosphoesterase family protein [Chloroflexota bacterium]